MKDTLLKILKASGNSLMKNFGKPSGFKIKESQSSIVTSSDLKSDSIITRIINERYPLHNIISEESGFCNRCSDFTWVIDPLDGTSNFASGIPWFGVLVTVFEGSSPVLAGACLPAMDITYFSEEGNATFKNGRKLTRVKQTDLKNSLISFSVDFSSDDSILNREIEIYRNLVTASRNIRSTNSLVDFLYTAEGKFGACINMNTRIWDISGLGLIVSGAGGVMKDIDGNNIKFALDDKIIEKNYAVMAGSAEIINKIREVIFKHTD